MSLPQRYEFEAIGTPWSIETAQPLSAAERQEIHHKIDAFDHAYSRFRADSLVSRARTAAGTITFPDSIKDLYDTYQLLETVTDGAVNPLVGVSLEHLGYDAAYSLRPATTTPQRPPSFTQTVSRKGTAVTFHAPTVFDIGAIGKGKLVDNVARYIAEHHDQYVVEAGGDMRIKTDEPYVIGLEHPLDTTQIIGTITVQDTSLCASAPNRRAWGEGLHHIIDARTGKPAKTAIIATWALADTAMLADALTTALFFTPAKTLHEAFGDFQYVVMKADGTVEHTITKG